MFKEHNKISILKILHDKFVLKWVSHVHFVDHKNWIISTNIFWTNFGNYISSKTEKVIKLSEKYIIFAWYFFFNIIDLVFGGHIFIKENDQIPNLILNTFSMNQWNMVKSSNKLAWKSNLNDYNFQKMKTKL